MTGPLTGLRVVELASIGPGPHAAMILADLGADVVRVERAGAPFGLGPQGRDQQLRGRRTVTADMKSDADRARVLALVAGADVFIEGNRPGVAERLGVGPDVCLAVNPRVVYGRMTGWGQDGPLAEKAGHDINYIAVSGILHAVGRADEKPVVPLNLIGDYGGGSMFLLAGILAALYERDRSGFGQVVDAAMVDGASMLAHMLWSMYGGGAWHDERGSNILDGGAPYYDTYECGDGRYMAVGAVEPQFYRRMLEGLGLDSAELPAQRDVAGWPVLRAAIDAAFRTRTRAQWTEVFDQIDACVSPVLSFKEARDHPHLLERGIVKEQNGIVQPQPSPRFSRTQLDEPAAPPAFASDLDALIAEWNAPRG
ncbi:CaiB/BaiF CoA transferase family protein [Microbacterium trichothecenolyticum]|uniref:Succinyl-CoA:(R)-benzylsuccinate CoA-transferase subunit BbsE n=1 Tax=Microbacterium trichothecenolyticum TaxID=69370 RepID=A0A0M2HDT6_MICTR|nr:CaiB/BaiF CoA-transferase family protein [Microbacterium trichothecenolyticum]KJL42347.1 Succinyl-CoA:(R)-benzylsuccinate CoA-transferase subunit BbsE [Microbacterium trichothecenolyticum]